MAKKRVFLIVLDGVGAGELPDAGRFGDEGSTPWEYRPGGG